MALQEWAASTPSNTHRTHLGTPHGSSRRIENYLGFPAVISGTAAPSRKFNARTATPYRAISLEPGYERHLVRLEEDREITAARPYRSTANPDPTYADSNARPGFPAPTGSVNTRATILAEPCARLRAYRVGPARLAPSGPHTGRRRAWR